MIVLIKFAHSLILIYMLICIALVWQYGFTGQYRRWLPLALGSLFLEGAVWLVNGMRCPLTDWAVALGDPTGADLLSEIIMPQPVNVMPGYITVFIVALVSAVRREWHYQKNKRT